MQATRGRTENMLADFIIVVLAIVAFALVAPHLEWM